LIEIIIDKKIAMVCSLLIVMVENAVDIMLLS